jgi:hypothetical protein
MTNTQQEVQHGLAYSLVEDIVKGSYSPISARFPNRFRKGNYKERLDSLASRILHTGLGLAEGIGSLGLVLSDDPVTIATGYTLLFDASSRIGAGQGIIASIREAYNEFIRKR